MVMFPKMNLDSIVLLSLGMFCLLPLSVLVFHRNAKFEICLLAWKFSIWCAMFNNIFIAACNLFHNILAAKWTLFVKCSMYRRRLFGVFSSISVCHVLDL
jgi:hypothetical protein